MPSVGTFTPKTSYVSFEIGSGMKPTMFTTQMKRKSDATYGNQRRRAFEGRLDSAICDCTSS